MRLTPRMIEMEGPDAQFTRAQKKTFCKMVNDNPDLNAELEKRLRQMESEFLQVLLQANLEKEKLSE